jgi:hypothetical protein
MTKNKLHKSIGEEAVYAANRVRDVFTNSNALAKKLGAFADSCISIYSKQEATHIRQAAHNSGHMLRTALAGAEYIMDAMPEHSPERPKAVALSIMAGLLHDMVMAPRETAKRGDGFITADLIEYMHGSMMLPLSTDYADEFNRLAQDFPLQARNMVAIIRMLSAKDVSAIADAIRVNEGTTKEIVEKISALRDEGNLLNAAIQEALLYGDKATEGIGNIVVVRRFQFVSGERCENDGDIGALRPAILADRFLEDEFRLLAFAGETMIRIYSNKSLSDFPSGGLWGNAKANRADEERIYRAVLKYLLSTHRGKFADERSIMEYLLAKGFPKMESSKESIRAKAAITLADLEGINVGYSMEILKFGLALAYMGSASEELSARCKKYAQEVSDKNLVACLESADSGALARRIKRIAGGLKSL